MGHTNPTLTATGKRLKRHTGSRPIILLPSIQLSRLRTLHSPRKRSTWDPLSLSRNSASWPTVPRGVEGRGPGAQLLGPRGPRPAGARVLHPQAAPGPAAALREGRRRPDGPALPDQGGGAHHHRRGCCFTRLCFVLGSEDLGSEVWDRRIGVGAWGLGEWGPVQSPAYPQPCSVQCGTKQNRLALCNGMTPWIALPAVQTSDIKRRASHGSVKTGAKPDVASTQGCTQRPVSTVLDVLSLQLDDCGDRSKYAGPVDAHHSCCVVSMICRLCGSRPTPQSYAWLQSCNTQFVHRSMDR